MRAYEDYIENFTIRLDPDYTRVDVTIANPSRKTLDRLAGDANRPGTLYSKMRPRFFEDRKNAIRKVIFHDPATIIFWKDGSKTVVKCKKGEEFNKMTGFAMCCCKHFFGDEGSNYQKTFKKWIGEDWDD